MTETELDPQQKNLWLKGVSAYQLKNLDYSINLILAVVKQVPDFLEGRKMLRRAEIDKVSTPKKSFRITRAAQSISSTSSLVWAGKSFTDSRVVPILISHATRNIAARI